MFSYMSNALVFLVHVVFGLYITIVMLRFLLQLVRADFYNPISQAVVKLTNPLLVPLRRIIPGLRGIDIASVVLLLALKLVEIYLAGTGGIGFGGVLRGQWVSPHGAAIFAIAELLKLSIYIAIFALLVQVAISWLNPAGAAANPAYYLLRSLTEPLLAPARRLIPPVSGLDLSPVAVFIGLQLALFLIVHPIADLGLRLM